MIFWPLSALIWFKNMKKMLLQKTTLHLQQHFYGISHLKLYLYGKYSTQTMIFWSLCASIWFKNMKKMLLQMTSGFLQLESTISTFVG
jgi:hypothetical protein